MAKTNNDKIDARYHQGTPHSTVPGVPHIQHKSKDHATFQGPPPGASRISPGGERHSNDGAKDLSWEDDTPNNGDQFGPAGYKK